MSIRNLCYGFLAISFLVMSMVGFLAPVIWPDLYYPFMSPIYGYGTPLVQHHIELCTYDVLEACTELDIFIV